MKKEEIFENRREVGKKICEHIRKNNRQMLNVKFFPERPYCDGNKKYKLSAANYLRLISSENKSIYNRDPRWVTKEETQKNGWTLKEYAESELLEVWQKSSDDEQECLLIEFYNASDIIEKEIKQQKNEILDNVLEFLKVRGLLSEIEKNPDRVFEAASQAQVILKKNSSRKNKTNSRKNNSQRVFQ